MTFAELREKAPARLTVNDAAAILSASISSVYRWIEDGKLPGAMKLNGIIRIDRDTLLDHLEGLLEAG
jgi:excisionase family DNA binding protein